MSDFVESLRAFDALRDGDSIAEEVVDAVQPVYAGPDAYDRLSRKMRIALERQGIRGLYQHQAEAIEKALSGSNVVLQAPTASGKTLAFQVPMLESLIQSGDSHALMIYPNKALALDQRDQLKNMTDQIPDSRIDSWWYDGDIEQEHRSAIRRKPPRILITNPDMLHNSFLAHADQWVKLYRGLKWVIVDEMHEYRGYFGSNVAMILRRFSHHLRSLGVRPQFFLCSATCANAGEHAQNLTGLQFEEINAAEEMRPRRSYTFVQPDIPDYQYWSILQLRAVKAGLACLDAGRQVLIFCPTRRFAEECHRTAMREIDRIEEEAGETRDKSAARVYRSGLDRSEREEIQEGLKNGSVRLVFTTNALELGIDIGSLDGVILAGFPDSMMSAWQRIGRAGRGWNSEAFVLYYPRNSPLDRFYAANLPTFLHKPLDDLVVNAENEDLIERHLPCLLYETDTEELDGGEEILGRAMFSEARKMRDSGAQPVYSGRWRPHRALDIRGSGSGTYILKDGKEKIGALSAQQQFREAFPDAIYLHGGRNYRVREVAVTGEGGEIALESAEQHLRTSPVIVTMLSERAIYSGYRWDCGDVKISAIYGEVAITDSIASVQEIDDRSGNVLRQWRPNTNTAQFDRAHAFWLQDEAPSEIAAAGVAALQHLLRVGALFKIPLDAHDVFPHCTARDQKAHIVESYRGGIGIARKILERWRQILEFGISVAEGCNCQRGCPNCIVPPRARDEVDKRDGVTMAQELLKATDQPATHTFSNGLWVPSRS